MLQVADIEIGEEELVFRAVRSSGPGGQNVNKVSTRVVLEFDVAGSGSLTEKQKVLVRRRLGRRVSAAGVLRVSAQEERTQAGNRRAAEERLAALLGKALAAVKARKKTYVPIGERRRRLEGKRRRSAIKTGRGKAWGPTEE